MWPKNPVTIRGVNQHGEQAMTNHPPTYLRVSQIIGNPKKGIPPLIPVSRTFWFEGVRAGRFPRPVYIASKMPLWRADEIAALMATFEEGNP